MYPTPIAGWPHQHRTVRASETGYGFNLGARRGIRIGSARDGSVKYFIPDPCPYPYPAVSSISAA